MKGNLGDLAFPPLWVQRSLKVARNDVCVLLISGQLTISMKRPLYVCVCVCVCDVCAQLCLTLCNPMDCSVPGSSVHGISQGKNTGVGCHFLLRGGDLPDPGIEPAPLESPTLQADSLPLNHLGSPKGPSQFSSVTQLCPTLCHPMDCSTSGLPVHHQLPEFTQTHVH